MASDINTVKNTLASDGAFPGTKGIAPKSSSGIDFAEIMRNNGSRLENGLNALSDRAGITSVGERPDNSPAADDRSYDRGDERHDNSDSRADTDDHSDHGSDRDASAHSDRSNDYASDRSQDTKPDTVEASDGGRDDSEHAQNHGENANRDDRSTDSSSDDGTSATENGDSETVAASNGDDGEQAAVKGDEGNKENTGNAGENAQNNAAASTAKQMLNSLLSNTQEAALPGQVAEQTQANTQNGNTKTNAAEGLNVAVANVGKQTDGNSANTGQQGANSQNTQAQAQTHNLANNQGQAQTQNNANAEMQAAADAQSQSTSKAAEQSAQLSKMVGNGNKVDVSVNVTDEKASLISKPTANLAANTVLAADSTAPSLRSQQAQGANNANAAGQAQQVAGQAAGAAGQVQQAVQQAAGAQTQSAATTAVDVKGAAQVNLHGGSQATVSGNGDTPVAAAPNTTSATLQAQQNTSAQAANSTRFTAANHAVADQVSVQISKALNAGNDKISIQLKPAELGRIDVQMEVGHDGRVTAVVTADNKSTLDLLQKDSKELQQALQQAGLHADNDSLSFNLREQGDGNEMAGSSGNGGDEGLNDGDDDGLSLEDELAGLDRDIITDTRVDVRA